MHGATIKIKIKIRHKLFGSYTEICQTIATPTLVFSGFVPGVHSELFYNLKTIHLLLGSKLIY
jgi:hypothetical protein